MSQERDLLEAFVRGYDDIAQNVQRAGGPSVLAEVRVLRAVGALTARYEHDLCYLGALEEPPLDAPGMAEQIARSVIIAPPYQENGGCNTNLNTGY